MQLTGAQARIGYLEGRASGRTDAAAQHRARQLLHKSRTTTDVPCDRDCDCDCQPGQPCLCPERDCYCGPCPVCGPHPAEPDDDAGHGDARATDDGAPTPSGWWQTRGACRYCGCDVLEDRPFVPVGDGVAHAKCHDRRATAAGTEATRG
jgi:hypothetical protein